ncbi:MAG: hypothetical protein AAF489_00965 [Bacteroidota bacterium]
MLKIRDFLNEVIAGSSIMCLTKEEDSHNEAFLYKNEMNNTFIDMNKEFS